MQQAQKIVGMGAASGVVINRLYRAPGMSATAYLNLGMIGCVLYHVFWSAAR